MKIYPYLFLKIGLAGVSLLMMLFSSNAQGIKEEVSNDEDRKFSVQWVAQYPAIKNEKKEKENSFSTILLGEGEKNSAPKRNKNWFTNLLFGKAPDELIKPMSILAIHPNSFWICDQGNGSILEVSNKVGEITHFKKKDFENLPSLVGSCWMPNDHILFTDSKLNKIFKFSPTDKNLSVFNESVSLEQPTGIAYSSVNKQIWVVETSAHRISILNEKGDLVKQIGARGVDPGQFNYPTFIWIDQSGIVFVVDAMNFRIQIFDQNGAFISLFGELGDASGYMTRPKGIATDSFGHIYVADALFHVVQVFDRNGKLLDVIGSKGQDKEQFWMPTGIYIDDMDYIYIADSYNSRVQIFQLLVDESSVEFR